MTRAEYRDRERLGRALLAADQAKVRTVRQVTDVQPLTKQQSEDILRHHCKELAPEQTRDIIDLFHQHISQDLATEMQPTASELHTELTECIDAILLRSSRLSSLHDAQLARQESAAEVYGGHSDARFAVGVVPFESRAPSKADSSVSAAEVSYGFENRSLGRGDGTAGPQGAKPRSP